MARSQQDSITILHGIKGYEVGNVREVEEDIVVEVRSRPKTGSALVVDARMFIATARAR